METSPGLIASSTVVRVRRNRTRALEAKDAVAAPRRAGRSRPAAAGARRGSSGGGRQSGNTTSHSATARASAADGAKTNLSVRKCF